MKKALINIDYTIDFIADHGALTCGKPGQQIESELVRITKEFIENGDYVVFAIDLHKAGDTYHPEAKLFPPHNIEGTEGRKLYGELEAVYQANKHKDNVYWMDKTRYSAFAGTDLEIKLRERGITEVHLVGCCTTYACFIQRSTRITKDFASSYIKKRLRASILSGTNGRSITSNIR